MTFRTVFVGLLLVSLTLAAGPLAASSEAPQHPDYALLPGIGDLEPYRGDLHAHTAYSDGEQTPEFAYKQARATGWLDFFVVTEHSEWWLTPVKADTACISPDLPDCVETSLPERTEWEEAGFQAQRFTDEGFLAMRGFEWSSPLEGHVNVYETTLWTDSVQTAPAPMTGLYAWLAAQVQDSDRFATFNHPGREPLMFDDFQYDARADHYMTSVESFNKDDEYTGWYLYALDKGWHVGTHGVTDGHAAHERVDPERGHTVALMDELSRDGLRRAMMQHHTVAIRGADQDARLTVDGVMFGDIVTDPGETVEVQYQLLDAGGDPFHKAELLGPRGWSLDLAVDPASEVSGTVTIDWSELPTTGAGERYLTLRAHQSYKGSVEPTVMTSAVWIAP